MKPGENLILPIRLCWAKPTEIHWQSRHSASNDALRDTLVWWCGTCPEFLYAAGALSKSIRTASAWLHTSQMRVRCTFSMRTAKILTSSMFVGARDRSIPLGVIYSARSGFSHDFLRQEQSVHSKWGKIRVYRYYCTIKYALRLMSLRFILVWRHVFYGQVCINRCRIHHLSL